MLNCSNDVFPPKEVPFGDQDDGDLIWENYPPKTCKDICWFCTGCGEVMAAKTDDRVLAVLDKVLDKLNELEDRLQQKADVKLG